MKQKTWEEKAREYEPYGYTQELIKKSKFIELTVFVNLNEVTELSELYEKALEEKNNEIEELKTEIIYNRKQIEKMKCCENCYHDNCRGSICRSCEGYNNWRIDK